MPALATLTLVWLGTAPPDAAQAATLERFARDRDRTIEAPRVEAPADPGEAWPIVQRCEAWLEQARDQLQAGDDEAAENLVAQIDQTLRQHPELLPAAWLMAQRYRVGASIARRTSPDRVPAFERLAETTEGARAPSFGEVGTAPRVAPPNIRVELAVHGARKHETYWDGAPTGEALTTTPGEHHLLVFRGARLAWAGWVSALAAGKIDVWVPDAAPCSAGDFEGVAWDATARAVVSRGVRCPSWVTASPGPHPGSLSIAVCNAASCERADIFSDRLATASPTEDDDHARKGRFPAWVTWSLAGVGVAAVTSLVLWQAGVFDTAKEPTVFYDGSRL